jgi:hypothetical protein
MSTILWEPWAVSQFEFVRFSWPIVEGRNKGLRTLRGTADVAAPAVGLVTLQNDPKRTTRLSFCIDNAARGMAQKFYT